MSIALAIHGAAGRMGSRVMALAAADPRFTIAAAIESPGHPRLGEDAGIVAGAGALGVAISQRLDATFDVMIDFSSPGATDGVLSICERVRRPLVTGTTGHSTQQLARIADAAGRIAIVHAPNMSVGVNVLLRLVRELAGALGEEYDVEIVETHHRFKADAPSGTAVALLDAVQAGRGASASVAHGRRGAVGARPRGEIGVHAVRLGDAVGDHVVSFGALGETLSVRHTAHTRDTFAAGALRAAEWVAGRGSGKYTMQDVLFERD